MTTAATIIQTRPTHWTGADEASDWIASARAYATSLRAAASSYDRAGEFVHDAFAQLKRDRFMSMLVPRAREA